MAAKNKTQPTTETDPDKKIIGDGPLITIAITVVAFIGSQIAAIISVLIYGMALKGLPAEETIKLLETSVFAQFLYYVIVALTIIFVIAYFLRFRKYDRSYIGLNKPTAGNLLLAVPVFVLYFVTLGAVVALVTVLVPSLDVNQEQQIGFDNAKGAIPLAMVFISLVIVPAVSEEILIRGFLYRGLITKFKKIYAAIIASAIFGFAHLQIGFGVELLYIAAIDTFLLSLFLIWLREKTGNIYAGMLVHAIKNSLAFTFLFILHKSI